MADDDEAFVASAGALLRRTGFRILTASTGEDALSVAREKKPLVVLLGVQLPVLNGYEVCRELRNEFGQTVAIAFVSGTRTEPVDISAGLLFGADDYFVKPFDPSKLVARVCALVRRPAPDKRGPNTGLRSLTSRERDVLRLLMEGLDQRNIALKLSISPNTVGIHVEHIVGKLEVHSRAQAIAAAYRDRLIIPSQ